MDRRQVLQIDYALVRSNDFNSDQKIILGEINSLDATEKGCFAEYKHFADIVNKNIRTTANMFSALKKADIIQKYKNSDEQWCWRISESAAEKYGFPLGRGKNLHRKRQKPGPKPKQKTSESVQKTVEPKNGKRRKPCKKNVENCAKNDTHTTSKIITSIIKGSKTKVLTRDDKLKKCHQLICEMYFEFYSNKTDGMTPTFGQRQGAELKRNIKAIAKMIEQKNGTEFEIEQVTDLWNAVITNYKDWYDEKGIYDISTICFKWNEFITYAKANTGTGTKPADAGESLGEWTISKSFS